MSLSPSESDVSRATSTLDSSVAASTLDMGSLTETNASGSDGSPCRSFHLVTFPQDGHLPHEGALSSGEFPAKPVVAECGGVGPWLRVRDTDRLLLCDRTVHWSAECPFLQRATFSLTLCYCVDKLHKCFHCDVDDNFSLHVNSRCSENVDIAAGWISACTKSDSQQTMQSNELTAENNKLH